MAPYYVCPKCEREMYPKKNGVYVIEMAQFGPYKVWLADLWACRKCGNETICGFALNPLAEHCQDDFSKVLKRAQSSDDLYYCREALAETRRYLGLKA